MVSFFPQGEFHARLLVAEVIAVIGPKNDDCIVRFAIGIQLVDQPPNHLICEIRRSLVTLHHSLETARAVLRLRSGVLIEELQDTETIITNPMFATGYFYFRCSDPPYSDSRVRKGLSLLLPWDEIRSSQFMFIPSQTLVPQVPSYPKVEGITTQDIDTGFSLLEEAGYPKGEDLGTIVIKIPPDFESRRITRIMKENWERFLETTVEIQEFTYPRYYQELQDSEYTLGTITWIGDFADPLTFLQMWTKDSNLNDAGYINEEFEKIVNTSMEQEGVKRYETLAEAEGILLQDAAVLPISHEPAWNIIDLNLISGWFPNPLDIHPFKFIGFAAQRLPPGVVKAE